MNRISQVVVLALGAVLALTASSQAADILAVRHSTDGGRTRIVFDLSAPAAFSHSALDNPDRVVLDVTGRPGPDVGPFSVDDPRVARVRMGSPADGVARFVVDLATRCSYHVFQIPADRDHPHRLVIDLAAAGAGTSDGKPRAPQPATPRRDPSAPFVVVVDPGHGGEDPGARGMGVEEKDVCLSVAEKVVNELNDRPGFKASLSRSGDRFIPLRGRIQIAENENADAFVSIHANASRSRSAQGTEVYFLSLSGATDEASRELAQAENSADLVGGVAPDADDDLGSILFDMQQTDVLQKGSLLAESVVNALRTHRSLTTRGVKQAGFVVLKSPRIPSILVETAFITNPSENRLLRNKGFQADFAHLVADGIVHYFQNVGVAELR